MANKLQILQALEIIAPLLPVPLYWLDTNSNILGYNELALRGTGATSDMVGKSVYDLHPYNIANRIVQHNNKVIKTGKMLSQEESIVDITTGKARHYLAFKAPLINENGEIFGTVGTSIENNLEILEMLEAIAPLLPIPLYWLDKKSTILGCNRLVLQGMGSPSDIIDKSVYDLYPYDIADKIVQHNNKVIKTGKRLSQEESIIDITTGKVRDYIAFKAPLKNKNKEIIGTLGTSVEITAEKEAQQRMLENERLKLENERYGAIAQDRERGMKLADILFRNQQAEITKHLRPDIVYNPDENIELSLWDSQVMYAVNRERDAKSAALFLCKMTDKKVTQYAVNTVLNKSLYIKFNVSNQNKLFEKAFLLKMMPLFFPTEEKPKKSRKKV